MKRIKDNDNATIVACYIGYITQAIVNNFVPLLFVTFQKQFGIALDKIGLLISVIKSSVLDHADASLQHLLTAA